MCLSGLDTCLKRITLGRRKRRVAWKRENLCQVSLLHALGFQREERIVHTYTAAAAVLLSKRREPTAHDDGLLRLHHSFTHSQTYTSYLGPYEALLWPRGARALELIPGTSPGVTLPAIRGPASSAPCHPTALLSLGSVNVDVEDAAALVRRANGGRVGATTSALPYWKDARAAYGCWLFFPSSLKPSPWDPKKTSREERW